MLTIVNYLSRADTAALVRHPPSTGRVPPIAGAYALRIKDMLQSASALNWRPLHAEFSAAVFAGDHDPVHAQRLPVRALFLPRNRNFVTNRMRELCRRHRHWLCN